MATSWKSIAWWSEVALPALAKHVPEAAALPASPMGLFPSLGHDDPHQSQEKLEGVGFNNVRVEEFKLRPMVEDELFAEANSFLVVRIAKRVWSNEDFEKFGGKIEENLLRFLRENWKDGVWDGEMTAIIALGSKE